MPELKSWFFKCKYPGKEFVAKGVVSGHTSPRCYDGAFIHTSLVEGVMDCGETLEIKTRNNVYTARKDMVSAGLMTAGDTEQALTAFLGEAAKPVIAQLREIRTKKCGEVCEFQAAASDKMENGQLFLALSSDKEYYFDYALYRNDSGELIHETRYVHVGMVQDSVLLDNSDVRYFPYKRRSLEFYGPLYMRADDGEERLPANDVVMGYILNSGSAALKVGFTWGKTIEILPGSTVTVSRDNINMLPDTELDSTEDLYAVMWDNNVAVAGTDDKGGSESSDEKE